MIAPALRLGAVAKQGVRAQEGVGAVSQGQAAVHAGLPQSFTGQHRGDHIRPLPAVFGGKMHPQQAERAHLAERFEIEGLLEIMLLHPGDDFLFGKPDHLFLEHELFPGERKIHRVRPFTGRRAVWRDARV